MPPPTVIPPDELGFPGEQAPPTREGGPPIGLGKYAVPQQFSFSGIVNPINRIFPYTFDEAMLHNRENAERMRFDPVIDACLRIRTMAVALLPWHLEPDDPEDPDQVKFAAEAEKILKSAPGQLNMMRALLDATFVGRSGYQNRWRWKTKQGRQWMYPAVIGRHIDGDKLVFRHNDDVGIRVHSAFNGPTITTDQGRAYILTPEEREQVIVHEFEPTDSSFFKPMQAGAIHGRGLRHHLYWLWSLKSRVWSLAIDWLEWFAQGLTVYYFESGNNAHQQEMQNWIEGQAGSKVLLMPSKVGADGKPIFTKVVERFEAGTVSPQFIQQLLTDYFDELIVRLILGQTLMTQTAATGLGSGVAAAHNNTFDNIIKYDSRMLEETLSDQYVRIFYRHNFPGIEPAKLMFDIDSPNVQQMIENAQAIWEMGGRIDEEALLEASGLPVPGAESTILSNVQPMQPTAVTGMPEGVPVQDASQPQQPDQDPMQLARVLQKLTGKAPPNPLMRLKV